MSNDYENELRVLVSQLEQLGVEHNKAARERDALRERPIHDDRLKQEAYARCNDVASKIMTLQSLIMHKVRLLYGSEAYRKAHE